VPIIPAWDRGLKAGPHSEFQVSLGYIATPAISLLDIYPKECKSIYNRHIFIPVFIEALFTIAELWNQ
jgi:hypothetical protein